MGHILRVEHPREIFQGFVLYVLFYWQPSCSSCQGLHFVQLLRVNAYFGPQCTVRYCNIPPMSAYSQYFSRMRGFSVLSMHCHVEDVPKNFNRQNCNRYEGVVCSHIMGRQTSLCPLDFVNDS